MWRQHIKFSNPGYIMMRATLNGAIGSSNYLTLPVFSPASIMSSERRGRDVLGESFRSLESEHRAFFEGLRVTGVEALAYVRVLGRASTGEGFKHFEASQENDR